MSRGEVFKPATLEELAELVVRAHRDRLTVMPRGSAHAPLPFRTTTADVVIDLTGLNRVVEHSPEDLVASIECGIGFDECARQLAGRGQRIPLDRQASSAGTLGGMLARNTYGPLRLRHGTARDWLIGSTLVRLDGRVVKAGGMVVKNVSGYDLGKLYVGSWGSLGILARANFKLAPLPEAELALAVNAERGAAARIVERARAEHLPLAMAVYTTGSLFLLLEGLPGVIEAQRDRLCAIARDEDGDVLREGRGESIGEWKRAWVTARHAPSAELHLRLSYPPDDQVPAWEAVEEVLTRPRVDPPKEASLPGCGVTWLSWPHAPGGWTTLVDGLRRICLGRAGWLMVERHPADAPETFRPWSIPSDQLAVMRGLKSALDPRGTFPDVLS